MVTVERSKESVGMTFAELGEFLVQRGAWSAVNLDGGGSTTMVSRDLGDFHASLAMQPSQGTQRLVPNGLGIFSTAPKGNLLDWSIYVPQRVLLDEKVAVNVKAYDEYYNPLQPGELPLVWNIPKQIQWNEDRTFIIKQPGTYEVTSTLNGKTEKHVVKPYSKNDIDHIKMDQDMVRIHPGESAQVKVTMNFTDGAKRAAPASSIKWQLLGVKGSVQADGTVKATQPSVGMLLASYQGFSTAIPVVVGATESRLIDNFVQAGRYQATGLTKSETASFAVSEEDGKKVGTFSYDFGPSQDIRSRILNMEAWE
jgi:hypothetical protein